MTENIRFIEVLDILKKNGRITDYVQAAAILGTNKAGISDIKSGRKKLQIEIIRRMKESYPDVSLDYILLGQGSPFIVHTPHPMESFNGLDSLIDKIAEQAEEIGRLREQLRGFTSDASSAINHRTANAV